MQLPLLQRGAHRTRTHLLSSPSTPITHYTSQTLTGRKQSFNFEPEEKVGPFFSNPFPQRHTRECTVWSGLVLSQHHWKHKTMPQVEAVKQALQEKEGIQVDQIR